MNGNKLFGLHKDSKINVCVCLRVRAGNCHGPHDIITILRCRYDMYCDSHDSICIAIRYCDFTAIRCSKHIAAAEGQEMAYRAKL